MSIANFENMLSNAERRALINGEHHAVPRIADLTHVAPSSRGKLELTMAEDEGHEDKLIGRLVDEAVKNVFTQRLDAREFRAAVDYFEAGKALGATTVDLRVDLFGATGAASTATYSHGASAEEPDGSPFRFEFVVPGSKAIERTLVLGWSDGRTVVDRDAEIAAEIFCEHLGEALDLLRAADEADVRLPRIEPRN